MTPATTPAREETKPAAADPAAPAAAVEEPAAPAPAADDGKAAAPPGKEAAAAGAKPAKAPRPKLTLPKLPPQALLAAVVVLSLAAGIALGVFVLGPPLVRWRKTPRPAVAVEPAPERRGGEKGAGKPPVVFRIDNIVVNPAGSAGMRFLMAAVAFDLDDERTLAVLREHEVEVRDAVVSALESQTLESLSRPGARDSLKSLLGATVAPVVGPGRRVRVYLPQFVIQ